MANPKKANAHDGISITVERISPAIAAAMLNANKTNRSLRSNVVEQYAADMRAGNWTRCTQPIVFFLDGDLGDGQHRLFAVIESGTTQEFVIMRGLARSDGLNIDTGLGRSVVDAARISGLDADLSTVIVAASRAIATGMPAAGRLSNAEKLAVVQEHREAAQFAASHLPHVKNICNSVTLGAIARAWYVERDHERLYRYCKVLGTGFAEGDADSAAIAMRNYLLTKAGLAASAPLWRDTFLKVQNSIEHFMARRRLTVIKSVKDEAYPLRKRQPMQQRRLSAIA